MMHVHKMFDAGVAILDICVPLRGGAPTFGFGGGAHLRSLSSAIKAVKILGDEKRVWTL